MRSLLPALLLFGALQVSAQPMQVTLENLRIEEGTFAGALTLHDLKLTLPEPRESDLVLMIRFEPGTTDADDVYGENVRPRRHVIPVGQRELKIRFQIVNDGVPEDDETFAVVVEGSDDVAPARGTVTIVDDDDRAALRPERVSIVAGERMTVHLVLPEPVARATTYRIETTPEGAVSVPHEITVDAGQSGAQFELEALTPRRNVVVTAGPGELGAHLELDVIRVDISLREPLEVSPGRALHVEPHIEPHPPNLLDLGFEATSSNSAVFIVKPKNGEPLHIEGVAPGTATLTLRSASGSIERRYTVTVPAAPR